MYLDISICVVLYKSQDVSRSFAEKLASSLIGFSGYEILFYDNSPDDALKDLVAYGTYFHDAGNHGFSYANNQLILQARHRNILLLNPDVFGFTLDFWERLHRTNRIGQVRFARLLNADGSFQDCIGEATSLARAVKKRPDYAAIRSPVRIGMGIMAFMLTDRSVFARVGLLDCDYPLYAEDMDWCYRANRHGVPVIYDPSLELTHLGSASSDDRWSRKQSLRRKYQAERVFIDKHSGGLGWIALRLLNWFKTRVRA